MPVKDKVVTWFIQNVILPKREIIDQPGFIITTFTEKDQVTYLRDLFLSEKLFEMIENKVVEKYGEQGKQALYSAGKKFSYNYVLMSSFPNINISSKKELIDFSYLFVRYIEGMYAKQANHEMDVDKKYFKIFYDNYVVCRNNGIGLIMTDAGASGTWAYVLQDKNIDGVQVKCQGRGDEKCFVVCGPEDVLKEYTDKFYREPDLPEHHFDELYHTMNEIRPTNYSQNSLKSLLDVGFFDYKEGTLSYKDIRFFHCESHILYFIEQEISKLEDGEQTLFDVCVEYGKYVRQIYGESDYVSFISDYYPALGFGDITVLDPNKPVIAAMYYPWTVYSETAKYIIFRGIMSGIVSDAENRKVEFNNYEIDISSYLTLTITADS